MTVRVRVLRFDAQENNQEAEVVIVRVPHGFRPPAEPPVSDLPADMREALLAWLGGQS